MALRQIKYSRGDRNSDFNRFSLGASHFYDCGIGRYVVLRLAACGLPKVGPNKRQIYQGSVQKDGDAFIVSVNDRVTRATAVTEALGFS